MCAMRTKNSRTQENKIQKITERKESGSYNIPETAAMSISSKAVEVFSFCLWVYGNSPAETKLQGGGGRGARLRRRAERRHRSFKQRVLVLK